jgi:membrane associated rhomboid family serine protease
MMLDTRELGRHPVHPALWAAVGLMALVEVMFWAAGRGALPPELSRLPVYAGFAFHDTLFEWARAEGVLPAQLLWSFLSYAFLHGGWLHLGVNAAALLGLGHAVSRLAGIGAFTAIFVGSAVAGALVFALITDTPAPLVGASGSVFGLLATITAWQEQALRAHGLPRRAIWQRIGGLALLNVVMYFGLGGLLAWEAHLGGFIAGWLLAYRFPPRLLEARAP